MLNDIAKELIQNLEFSIVVKNNGAAPGQRTSNYRQDNRKYQNRSQNYRNSGYGYPKYRNSGYRYTEREYPEYRYVDHENPKYRNFEYNREIPAERVPKTMNAPASPPSTARGISNKYHHIKQEPYDAKLQTSRRKPNPPKQKTGKKRKREE